MKRSNILRLIVSSQILGLMTLPCALSMQPKTIDCLSKVPLELISSFLSLEDLSSLGQTSKKFDRITKEARWNRRITFSLEKENGIKYFESTLKQLRHLNFPELSDRKEEDTQEAKEESATESTNKKRKKALDKGGSTNKKAKPEIKYFKKMARLDLRGVHEDNINEVECLLNQYKDYIKDVSVELCSNDGNLIAEFIKNTTITSINLEGNDISAEGITAIAKALKKTIRSINLTVDEHNIESVRILLNQHKDYIKDVSVRLRSNDGKLIAEFIKNTNITSIDLSCNKISAEGITAIAKALEKNESITSIVLRGIDISNEGAEAMAEALETNKSITSIDLSHNEISDKGAKAIAKVLEKNEKIERVDLSCNELSEKGATAMARVLEKNKKIKYLNLHQNFLAGGIEHIVNALKENKTITSIDLRETDIGDKALVALADMLKTNTTITSLKLGTNWLNDNEIKPILDMLKENKTITLLDLSEARYTTGQTIKLLAEVLKVNETITSVDWGCNQCGGAEEDIANMLKVNKTITSIGMGRMLGATSEGLTLIIKALETNTTIRSIDFTENDVSEQVAQDLVRMLEINTSIRSIGLSHWMSYKKISEGIKEKLKNLGEKKGIKFTKFKL